jgi:hypothetical protein
MHVSDFESLCVFNRLMLNAPKDEMQPGGLNRRDTAAVGIENADLKAVVLGTTVLVGPPVPTELAARQCFIRALRLIPHRHVRLAPLSLTIQSNSSAAP